MSKLDDRIDTTAELDICQTCGLPISLSQFEGWLFSASTCDCAINLFTVAAPSDRTSFPLMGERYEVVGLLGHGVVGSVYQVLDKRITKSFAVKVLHKEFAAKKAWAARFRTEVKSESDLIHKNMVTIYRQEETEDGAPYVVMDYLGRRSLASILEVEEKIDWEQAIPIFIQICDALAFAHSTGVIHGNIKPSNIFLVEAPMSKKSLEDERMSEKAADEAVSEAKSEENSETESAGSNEGKSSSDEKSGSQESSDTSQDSEEEPHSPVGRGNYVLITDFGATRVVATPGRATLVRSSSGTMLTSAHYLSPELCQGEKADRRSDVYSLGCIMYQALAGEPPFAGQSAEQVIASHLRTDPEDLTRFSDVPPSLSSLIMSCLMKVPSLRPQTIAEVRQELIRFRDSGKTKADSTYRSRHTSATQAKTRSFLFNIALRQAVLAVTIIAMVVIVSTLLSGTLHHHGTLPQPESIHHPGLLHHPVR